jgi:3-oxoacyl-[acyl-carrier-protein] synthase-3
MADVSAEILRRNNLCASELALFVPHQANIRIIDAAAERLGLNSDQVIRNIDRYANTTGATIPIGLAEAYHHNRLRKGDYVLLATFGAGFTSGSLLMRWAM